MSISTNAFPFPVNGTTDIAITETRAISCGFPASSIVMVFELKKEIQQHHAGRTALRHAAADLHSNFTVVSVLTDLNDCWQFFWFEANRTLCTQWAPSRDAAITWINEILAHYLDSGPVAASSFIVPLIRCS